MSGTDEVFRNLDKWAQTDVPVALYGLGRHYAARGEREMRLEAPWKDHSRNARRGLQGLAVLRKLDELVVLLVHGMDYGVHLEHSKNGKYAILKPTAERLAPEMLEDAKRILGARP